MQGLRYFIYLSTNHAKIFAILKDNHFNKKMQNRNSCGANRLGNELVLFTAEHCHGSLLKEISSAKGNSEKSK